jgi:NAD(P)-dependent dehydrogenase (short-subunit alcohol dehydrogenase family)
MRLENKVAIVTGAGQGIGEAAAIKMAEEGAKVVVSDINEQTGNAVAERIRGAGGEAVFVAADVSNVDDVKALMASTQEAFGRLDVLHNNAGVHETNFTEQAQSFELDEAVWDKVVGINLKGVWMCSKYAAPLLAEGGGGAIVSAASIGGLIGYPMGSAYGPSKAGVVQLTRAATSTRRWCRGTTSPGHPRSRR